MKHTGIFILIILAVWIGVCCYTSSELYGATDEIVAFVPVANADTIEETTAPADCYLFHEWSDWSITKVDNLMGPGNKVRTCNICHKEQSRAFMETVNGICIPRLRINTAFANVDAYNLLNSDFVYYTPDASHPTVESKIDLSSLKQNDRIYINTEWGLSLYVVETSEPATLNANGDLIGDRTYRGLWQHDYERSLHMYYLDGDTGWIVVARYLGIPNN